MNLCTFSSEYGPVFIRAQPIQPSNQKSWKTGLPLCFAFSNAAPKSTSHWIPAIVSLLAPNVDCVFSRQEQTRTCFLPVPAGAAGDSPERPVERMGGDTPLPYPGDESGMSPASGTGSERAQGRERLITEPPGIQRSVPEEAVHRESRCAAPGEAPGRGVPTAVR